MDAHEDPAVRPDREQRVRRGRLSPRRRAPRKTKARDEDSRPRESKARAVAKHPLAVTIVSALLIAWLVPAFAHQWQDRQTERELKRDIATQLDRDTTVTVIATRILIDRRFPEAQTTDARVEELVVRPGRKVKVTDALTAARERERDAAARTYIKTFSDWLVARSVTRSTLAAEFLDGALAGLWEDYSNKVTSYLRLASIRDVAERRELVSELSTYLHSASFELDWTPLAQVPGRVQPQFAATYARANATLAERLLDRKKELVQGVLRAHAAGYSTRPSDLIRDLIPFAG